MGFKCLVQSSQIIGAFPDTSIWLFNNHYRCCPIGKFIGSVIPLLYRRSNSCSTTGSAAQGNGRFGLKTEGTPGLRINGAFTFLHSLNSSVNTWPWFSSTTSLRFFSAGLLVLTQLNIWFIEWFANCSVSIRYRPSKSSSGFSVRYHVAFIFAFPFGTVQQTSLRTFNFPTDAL